MCHHFGQLGFARTRGTVQQHVHAQLFALHGIAHQTDQHLDVVVDKVKIYWAQLGFSCGPGEHGHQLALVAVLAHQHRGQFFAYLHQVGQVGDVVLAD